MFIAYSKFILNINYNSYFIIFSITTFFIPILTTIILLFIGHRIFAHFLSNILSYFSFFSFFSFLFSHSISLSFFSFLFPLSSLSRSFLRFSFSLSQGREERGGGGRGVTARGGGGGGACGGVGADDG
jgi:uncharacterized membrane protein YgcG